MKALANLQLSTHRDEEGTSLATDETHLAKINQLHPRPLVELKSEDVFVRAMKLTGDMLNSYHGKFRTSDLGKLAELSIGAPVLVGHNKMDRPLGRIFDGSVSDGFLITSFYIPSARSDAKDLIADIDTGVACECSISFQFTKPTCSKCGNDIRKTECKHYPGIDGTFYYYDGITRLLEGSIVYRGAHPDTGFVRLSEVDDDWRVVLEKNPLREMQGSEPRGEEGEVLGRNLGRFLASTINRRVTSSRSRANIISEIARDSGDSTAVIRSILAGEVRCPDLPCLRSFAKILRIDIGEITRAGEADGCNDSNRRQVLIGGKLYEREVI